MKNSVLPFLVGTCLALSLRAQPIDEHATAETRALFANLGTVARDHILVGHHHTTARGAGWRWQAERSDVRVLVGDFPAVHSWDFSLLVAEPDRRADARRDIVAAFERGAVITLSWHAANPVSGGGYNDHTPAVAAILPGGSHHEKFLAMLDDLAGFLATLRDKNGRAVPVIFRPWHEHTGATMWWGQPYCTKDEFIALWRLTVHHLRNTRGLHQLLWAYSPNRRASPETYFERYPGDEWVDLLGYDFYSKSDLARAVPCLRLAVAEAAKRGKLAALTETGPQAGWRQNGKPDYFTGELLPLLRDDPALRGLAYVLFWQNASEEQHWIPLPGEPGAEDFKKFHADPFTLFERDLPRLYTLPPDSAAPAAAPKPQS
ncbi:MAG: beta-mannosidase [Opitutae bacterium]|nr:beta-mannosidase [Opitutae bacterium]